MPKSFPPFAAAHCIRVEGERRISELVHVHGDVDRRIRPFYEPIQPTFLSHSILHLDRSRRNNEYLFKPRLMVSYIALFILWINTIDLYQLFCPGFNRANVSLFLSFQPPIRFLNRPVLASRTVHRRQHSTFSIGRASTSRSSPSTKPPPPPHRP